MAPFLALWRAELVLDSAILQPEARDGTQCWSTGRHKEVGTPVLAPTLPAKSTASRDWRDDSGGKGPAELAWGPEFRFLAPMSKAGHHSDHL